MLWRQREILRMIRKIWRYHSKGTIWSRYLEISTCYREHRRGPFQGKNKKKNVQSNVLRQKSISLSLEKKPQNLSNH